jgi:hypothetical protein
MGFASRCHWRIKRAVLSCLGFPGTCPYINTKRECVLKTGYMIISFVQKGQLLSDTFMHHIFGDPSHRQTLFGDLAKIMISLNRVKLPLIGSLTFNNDGTIELKNRPLTLRLQTFENEGIPTIPRNVTYNCVEPYLLDLLRLHDSRIYYQPNAIHHLRDGKEQFAALTMMRALLPQFISRRFRDGPFGLTLTDLHPSNIFVDGDWHITSLIDLEWACSLPIELQTAPYWLTGQHVDEIYGENLQIFAEVMDEFIDAFYEQEQRLEITGISQADIMRKCFIRGSYWYLQAVQNPKCLLKLFGQHVQGRYCEEHCYRGVFDEVVSRYWNVGAEEIIQKKVQQKAEYKDRLRVRFGVVEPES